MSLSLQQTAIRPASVQATNRFSDQLKEFCYRILSPNAEMFSERLQIGWEDSCLERADELTRELKDRYTLFIGADREGLLVANLLANRFGASLAELQTFSRGMIWMSGQVKETQWLKRVLVILPVNPQFTEAECNCLESGLSKSIAYATSAVLGAPLLPIHTVSTLSAGPHRDSPDS